MTTQHPTFQSPILAEPAVGGALSMADLTGAPIILVQGDVAAELPGDLPLPDAPGKLAMHKGVAVARLTPGEVYLFAVEPQAVTPAVSDLERHFQAAGAFAHATDLTHGKAVIKLSGSAAAEALSKLCGLNFADSAFPSGQVKQTSAAKIKTLIARIDENSAPTYFLHVNRPYGQYFWDILRNAGEEFDRRLTAHPLL